MSTVSSATKPHVLIVGAGLGGLCLAHGLKKHAIDFSIFERDDHADARAQGYRIKIFPDTIPDLKYLISPELFAEFEATTAETVTVETVISAINAQVTARRTLRGPKPYTVDRGFLRKVLLRGLEENIQWGKDSIRYEIDESNQKAPVTVHFADGSSASGTLLVGADGNHSRLRKQLVPNHQIIDPEGICLYGRTYLTSELKERMHPKLSKGLTVVRDVAPVIQQIIFNSEMPISMFIERMHFPHRGPDHPELPEDYMYWSMLVPSKVLGFTEEMVREAFNSQTPTELTTVLTSEWDDSIKCLIDLQDDSYTAKLRIISSLPDMSEWESSPYVTLVGDAIHVMSPSGGVGAATSIKDAVALTKALAGPTGVSLASIKEYEATMRVVAKTAIERSFRGGKLLYAQPDVENCRILPDA
jgi:2-polyprenyl-6-methoxyphenol hydroxylase-like FAD-dependent oxidoreductase